MQIKFKKLHITADEYKILVEYKKTLTDIQSILSNIYTKLGDKVSFAEINKYNRFTSLEKNIINEIEKLSGISIKTTAETLKGIYSDTFISAAKSIDTASNLQLGFYDVNSEVLKKIVNNPLDKVTWQFRNKLHHENLIPRVQSLMSDSFIKKKGYVATAREMKKQFDGLANNALRIVRTESHRVYNTAMDDQIIKVQASGKRLGLEVKKIWDAGNSKKPRPNHLDMDGQAADEDGLFTMITIDGATIKVSAPGNTGVASEDVNCHCLLRTEIVGL